MLGSSLTTEVVYRNGYPVVQAAGEVDLATAPVLRNVLDELIETGRPSIVLDLQKVTYFDASGLNVLLGIRRNMDEHRGSLRLVSPARSVARVLQLIGFFGLFPVYRSLDQALDGAPAVAVATPEAQPQVHQVEITVQSRPEMVGKVRHAIERVAKHDGLPAPDVEDLKIAVSEACTNAIKHGSPQGGRNQVVVRYQRWPDRVVVEVKDQGTGFDFNENALIWPDVSKEGSRGLFLIRELMDHLSYSRGNSGGVLRMERLCTGAASG